MIAWSGLLKTFGAESVCMKTVSDNRSCDQQQHCSSCLAICVNMTFFFNNATGNWLKCLPHDQKYWDQVQWTWNFTAFEMAVSKTGLGRQFVINLKNYNYNLNTTSCIGFPVAKTRVEWEFPSSVLAIRQQIIGDGLPVSRNSLMIESGHPEVEDVAHSACGRPTGNTATSISRWMQKKKKQSNKNYNWSLLFVFFVDSRRLSSYFSFGVTETQSRNMKTCWVFTASCWIHREQQFNGFRDFFIVNWGL